MLLSIFPLLLRNLGLMRSTWLVPLFSWGLDGEVDVIGKYGIGARVLLLGAGGGRIRFGQTENLPVLLDICNRSAISGLLFSFSMRSLYLTQPLGKGGRSLLVVVLSESGGRFRFTISFEVEVSFELLLLPNGMVASGGLFDGMFSSPFCCFVWYSAILVSTCWRARLISTSSCN